MAEPRQSIVPVLLCNSSKGVQSTYVTRRLSQSYLFINRSTPSHNSVTTSKKYSKPANLAASKWIKNLKRPRIQHFKSTSTGKCGCLYTPPLGYYCSSEKRSNAQIHPSLREPPHPTFNVVREFVSPMRNNFSCVKGGD